MTLICIHTANHQKRLRWRANKGIFKLLSNGIIDSQLMSHRAWQTAGRQRQSQSASRTPQNRSSAGSPSQQTAPTQPPKSQQSMNNAWTSNAASSNGAAVAQQESVHQPVNGFNSAEVKAFLGREGAVPAYKPAQAMEGNRSSGGAWGSKSTLD